MARITGSYLQQRRSGQWLVQIAVPKDLKARGLPISKYGKPLRKIEHYLHTRDEKEAEDRKHAEIAKIKEMFARLRAGMVITDVEVRRIATAEEWRVYNLLEENHADYPFGFEELARKTGHDLLFSASDDGIVNPLLPGKVTTTEFVTDLLRKHQYVVDAESIDRVEDALLRAQQSAIARISKGMRPPPAPDKHQMKSTPFSEHAKQYLAHPDTRLADVTAQQCRGTYRLFKDHIADAPLASVNRRTVAEFKDRLAQLHKDYGRHPDSAKLTLQQLLERYPAGERPLSAKTVNRHLSALSALWVWAQREGHFVDDAANPCVNQSRKVDKKGKPPMSIDDMNKAFAGTVGTPLKWCMLIAAFAGMRAGEVANLTAAEVKRSPRGVWYFDLTSRGVNVGNGESVKSDAGRRVIPVHAVLLEQGLLEYVTKIGKGPLFPTVRPRRDGSRGHHLSQIFARHAQKREIKSSFHRFRGAFIWALDHAGIDPDRKAYVVGHGRSWTSKTYNEPGLAADAVVDVVAAVKYEGLKL